MFTLDIRYSDTDLSKGDCNAFTSDFAARGNINNFTGTSVTAINPTGVASNWCGAAGIVKLSADLTAMTNLKSVLLFTFLRGGRAICRPFCLG